MKRSIENYNNIKIGSLRKIETQSKTPESNQVVASNVTTSTEITSITTKKLIFKSKANNSAANVTQPASETTTKKVTALANATQPISNINTKTGCGKFKLKRSPGKSTKLGNSSFSDEEDIFSRKVPILNIPTAVVPKRRSPPQSVKQASKKLVKKARLSNEDELFGSQDLVKLNLESSANNAVVTETVKKQSEEFINTTLKPQNNKKHSPPLTSSNERKSNRIQQRLNKSTSPPSSTISVSSSPPIATSSTTASTSSSSNVLPPSPPLSISSNTDHSSGSSNPQKSNNPINNISVGKQVLLKAKETKSISKNILDDLGDDDDNLEDDENETKTMEKKTFNKFKLFTKNASSNLTTTAITATKSITSSSIMTSGLFKKNKIFNSKATTTGFKSFKINFNASEDHDENSRSSTDSERSQKLNSNTKSTTAASLASSINNQLVDAKQSIANRLLA